MSGHAAVTIRMLEAIERPGQLGRRFTDAELREAGYGVATVPCGHADIRQCDAACLELYGLTMRALAGADPADGGAPAAGGDS